MYPNSITAVYLTAPSDGNYTVYFHPHTVTLDKVKDVDIYTSLFCCKPDPCLEVMFEHASMRFEVVARIDNNQELYDSTLLYPIPSGEMELRERIINKSVPQLESRYVLSSCVYGGVIEIHFTLPLIR